MSSAGSWDVGTGLRGIPTAVAGAIGVAWLLVLAAAVTGAGHRLHHDDLIEGGPGVAAALGLSTLAWIVMVTAMMLPSSLPLIRLFAAASAGQPRPNAARSGFLAGYGLVWTSFGVLAFVFDLGVHTAVHQLHWLEEREWLIGASVLALAGAFQFTRLKDACLEQCRHPAAFLVSHYRRGARAGYGLGVRHGLFCVGCCWALMLVMFAVGIANLFWMGLLTLVMVHEKTRPAGRRTVPFTGAALLALAAFFALIGVLQPEAL